MKITIDTKEDSQEEIKKVIKMLSSLVSEQEILGNQGNIFPENSGSSESNQNDMFSVFNSGSANVNENTPSSEKKESKDDEASINISDIEEYI